MSLNTNSTMIRMPITNRPSGKKMSAAALTPTVPMNVTASGDNPILSRPFATGVITLPTTARAFV